MLSVQSRGRITLNNNTHIIDNMSIIIYSFVNIYNRYMNRRTIFH